MLHKKLGSKFTVVFKDLIAILKKDKEKMEKQKEDDQELNRVMSQTGSVDAGELPTDLPSHTTTAAAVGSATPHKLSAGQGATAAAAAAKTTQPSG